MFIVRYWFLFNDDFDTINKKHDFMFEKIKKMPFTCTLLPFTDLYCFRL